MNPPPEDVIREALGRCVYDAEYNPGVSSLGPKEAAGALAALDTLLTELEQVKRDHMSDVRLLQAQLRTAREALEKIAEPAFIGWSSGSNYQRPAYKSDLQNIARQALTHLEGEGL